MNLFYLHPDDRRWLKRWFRNNLVCCGAIVGFLLLLRVSTAVLPEPPGTTVRHPTRAITPEGWRRTNHGWEHTTTWLLPSADQARTTMPLAQPLWATATLETIRNTSPLVIALGQITAVAGIVCLSRRAEAATT